MEVFVVLTLALAVAAVGMVVVAAVVLLRQLRLLKESVQDATERVRGLTTELQEEAAVLALETDALQRRLAQGRDGGRGRYTASDTSAPVGS